MNSNGSIGTCYGSFNPNGNAFNSPVDIVFNPNLNLAYITNGDNSIAICPVNFDGSFGTFCTVYEDSINLSGPAGLTINSAASWIYVADLSNFPSETSEITPCPLSSCETVEACSSPIPTTGTTTPDYPLSSPAGIVLNPNNNLA